LSFAQDDERLGRFAPLFARDANHGAFEYGRVFVERVFDFRAGDVFATGDDDVLLAVDDVDGAELVPDREVAGVEVAVVDGAVGLFRLFPVALQHHVAAHANFADGGPVHGDGVAVVVEELDVGADGLDAGT